MVAAEVEAAAAMRSRSAATCAFPTTPRASWGRRWTRSAACHVVVNNAGSIRRNVRLHEVGVERWDEQIAINLRGPYLVLHAALPELLRADGDRSIVNVASTLAVKPAPGIAPYAAAKGALISLTRRWRSSTARDGIRCNAVLPAVVRTPLAHADRPDFEERADAMAEAYPLGRLGEPDDVAEAIRWLVSPRGGLDHGNLGDGRRRLHSDLSAAAWPWRS